MTFKMTLGLAAGAVLSLAGMAGAQQASTSDPRASLRPGFMNAGEAAKGMELLAHRGKPVGFGNPDNPGDFQFANADLAFEGNLAFQGGYNGFQVWNLSNPHNPTIRTTFACAGGQGDPSVFGNLLFLSVEETRGRLDCTNKGVPDTVSAERFRGVRIFDISDLDHPKQIAAVQTCRGSHTHTLVSDPHDTANLYVYVSGTSGVRSPNELAGCSPKRPEDDPNTSLFRIEVIRVPLAAPQDAKVIDSPRLFASGGVVNGLWKGGAHGEGTQETYETNMCHDITVYTQLGLAAGACSGNGLLLDISDPAKPKRITEVMDPNFAYWHSATFNNDGTKLLFTDEWGGGVAPRCRATDKLTWGADAIFTLSNRTLTPAGYFKLPAAQSDKENCVAHNGNLIPVPGRDIMVQAWYQGGISVVDFTDAAHPAEIAYFDRGPVDNTLVLGGYWSAYWYNGNIVGSEIARGLDVFSLTPSDQLTQNEIDAAKSVKVDLLNPQDQKTIVWPAVYSVPRAYLDQLARNNGLGADRVASIRKELDAAEKLAGAQQKSALTRLAAQLDDDATNAKDTPRARALAGAVRALATR